MKRRALTGYVGLSAAWSGGLVKSSGRGAPSSDGLYDVKMLTKVNGLERVVLGAAAPAASILLALSRSHGRFCSVPNFCVHYPSPSQTQPPHQLSSQLWTDPKHQHSLCCCPGVHSNRNGSVEPPVHAAIIIVFGPNSPPNHFAGQPAGGPYANRAAGGATGPPGRSNSRRSARRSIQPPRRSILPPGDAIPARRSAVAPARRRLRFRR